MPHDHSHGANRRVLLISFFIITGYMLVEAVGGWLTNSLALLSDAGHMLSDSISLGVAVLAFSVGRKTANYSKTYGYKRFEILAGDLQRCDAHTHFRLHLLRGVPTLHGSA